MRTTQTFTDRVSATGPAHIGLKTGLLGLATVLGIYLTGVHVAGGAVACPTVSIIDCRTVLSGPGSVIAGIPLSTWGALWAAGGIGIVMRHRSAWLTMWIVIGLAGLGWAWTHEWVDHAICLWCTGMQGLVLGAILLSVAWHVGWMHWRDGMAEIIRMWRSALITGALAVVASLGYAVWLGSDRWVWMTCVSVLWGTAVAWLTAIGLTVWRRRLWVAHASTVPVTLATSIGATVCVGGACAVTSSIMAPLGAIGLGGLVSVSSLALLPLFSQGVFAMAILVAGGIWTIRRGAVNE